MALKNAFDGLATESQIERLIAGLESLGEHIAESNEEQPLARDLNDRLRVIVDATSVVLAYNFTSYWCNGQLYAPYYGLGLLGSMDPREQHQASVQGAVDQTIGRWTFT